MKCKCFSLSQTKSTSKLNPPPFFFLYLAFWTKAEQNVWPMRAQLCLGNQSKRTVQEPAQPGSQGNHTSIFWTHPGCLLFFLESQRTETPGRPSQDATSPNATTLRNLKSCYHIPQQYQSNISPPPARELEFKKGQGRPGHHLDSKMHISLHFISELEVPFKIFWFNTFRQCLAGQWNWHSCCLWVCELSYFLWSSEQCKLSMFQSSDHLDVFVT